MQRRTFLGAALATGALPTALRAAPALRPRTERLTVTPARSTDMTVWTPARVRGAALLSTGHGAWPERYDVLAQELGALGFATLAPLHVDSVRHPDRARFTLQQSFPERLADLRAASAYAAETWSGLPVMAAGHSFGTLSSLCLAGALPYLGDFRDPSVGSVLAFSSPGRVPGLIRPDAYASVKVPLLLVTGTEDRVPGFVANPADHLLAPETVSGPSFALVLAGGTHDLAGGGPYLDRARPPVHLFVEGYPLRDAAARRRLAAWTPARGDRFTVRNAA